MLKARSMLIFVLMLLTACSTSRSLTPESTEDLAVAHSPSETPGPTHLTPTISPTATSPTPPTSTPTDTPLSYHPSPDCPAIDSEYQIPEEISFDQILDQGVVEFALQELNQGASLADLSEVLPGIHVGDLNGNGFDEILGTGLFDFYILGCETNEYVLSLDYLFSEYLGPRIDILSDVNNNGFHEIVLYGPASTGSVAIEVLEWNGRDYVFTIQPGPGSEALQTSTQGRSIYWYQPEWSALDHGFVTDSIESYWFEDSNQDGIPDLNIQAGIPFNPGILCGFGPWRTSQLVFYGNGSEYILVSLSMDPPEYRFQAVQDADRYFLLGEYQDALSLYLQAIYADELKPWSEDVRASTHKDCYESIGQLVTPTPNPPVRDESEFRNIVAYSRYRLFLLYLVQGEEDQAEAIYNSLVEKYPENEEGHAFAQMAALTWNSYQESGSLAAACQPAVDFVKSDPAIMAFFGNLNRPSEHPEYQDAAEEWWHGAQSHTYIPEDLCPFGSSFMAEAP